MNDTPLSVDTGRGFSINYKGINLYSKYNPKKSVEKIISQFTPEEETLYILPSPLLFYGVEELHALIPETSRIIAIEVDQKLMKLSLETSSTPYEKIKYVRLDKKIELQSIIKELGEWRFRRCRLVSLNSGYLLNKAIYDNLFQFASHMLNTFWRNKLTINKLGPLWFKNIITNIPLLNHHKPNNKNKPIVICGAGPSLDNSLELLKHNRSSVYIIAVDTALSTLLKSSIEPDLVYALESQFYNLKDFYEVGDTPINLLVDITSYPSVCRAFKGEKFFSATDFYPNALMKRLEEKEFFSLMIQPLGSVGVAAVAAALQLFKEDIYLTGLDFAYIPGQSHSKGSPFVLTQLEKNCRFKSVDAYSHRGKEGFITIEGKRKDKQITTDRILQTYGNLLSEMLSSESRVFDLSQEGYPLGIPFVSAESFCDSVNNQQYQTLPASSQASSDVNALDFLIEEKNLLQDLIGHWDAFAQKDMDEIPQSLIESLEKVDYIYITFPDRLPYQLYNISFVSRAVQSARQYCELIDRTLSIYWD